MAWGGADWWTELARDIRNDYFYFANSSYTKNDFIKIFPFLHPDLIKVAYLAFDKEIFHIDFNEEKNAKIKSHYKIPNKRYIFTLHSIDPRKNLTFSASAFIEFIHKYNILDLVFVMGGGINPVEKNKIITACITKAKELNIPDPKSFVKSTVIFAGYVEDLDIANLFSHCLMSVYLSTYEGFGMPALEALACGAPVIASSTTSLPEVVGDGGILIYPKNKDALLQAFYDIYFDEKYRQELIQKGLKQAPKFSWEASAKLMYEQICAKVN